MSILNDVEKVVKGAKARRELLIGNFWGVKKEEVKEIMRLIVNAAEIGNRELQFTSSLEWVGNDEQQFNEIKEELAINGFKLYKIDGNHFGVTWSEKDENKQKEKEEMTKLYWAGELKDITEKNMSKEAKELLEFIAKETLERAKEGAYSFTISSKHMCEIKNILRRKDYKVKEFTFQSGSYEISWD